MIVGSSGDQSEFIEFKQITSYIDVAGVTNAQGKLRLRGNGFQVYEAIQQFKYGKRIGLSKLILFYCGLSNACPRY